MASPRVEATAVIMVILKGEAAQSAATSKPAGRASMVTEPQSVRTEVAETAADSVSEVMAAVVPKSERSERESLALEAGVGRASG